MHQKALAFIESNKDEPILSVLLLLRFRIVNLQIQTKIVVELYKMDFGESFLMTVRKVISQSKTLELAYAAMTMYP